MSNRVHDFGRRLVAATLLFAALCQASAAAAPAAGADVELPRYWLKVGQELNYRTVSEFTTAEGTLASESTWQIWVVKQNADATWRLILRHAANYQQPAGAGKPSAGKPSAGKTPGAKTPASKAPAANVPATKAKPAPGKAPALKARQPRSPGKAAALAGNSGAAGQAPLGTLEQVSFAYCDFSPDGSIVPNSTLGFQFEPRQLLLKLPKSDKELEKGWTDLDPSTQVGYRCRVEEGPKSDDDEQLWTIAATRQSPVDDIYLSRSQSVFSFDGDRGLVERIETKLEQEYGVQGAGTSTTQLTGVEQFDGAWCKRLDEEMGLYFEVERRYQARLQAAERDSVDAETLLVEAGALLQKAAAEITLPVVKEDLRKQVALHSAMIGFTARAARDRADLIDQPAPAWQTKSLEGEARALRDYKGKAVVLHFWRRGDGWSLRSLPQIERLAEKFTDEPVAVLGMNTDLNEEDARFVADKMGLAYPILRADKFAEKYNAAASSAVVVIDQKGIVRDIRVGYSPTLGEDIAEAVSRLLADD